METVNSIASAASRAIWGDGNKDTETSQTDSNETTAQEPLSGETGNVDAVEPYDKGNAVDSTTSELPDRTVTATNPSTTGVTSHNGPTPGVTGDKSTSLTDKSLGAESASTPQKTPDSDTHERIQEAKKEAKEAATVDTSGPGPKSLEEKAREGGGVNGVASTSAAGGDDADGPQKESHGEGTGEKYVESSGVKADGGDFDAANPGAGKEADRLLADKGVTRETPSTGNDSTVTDTTDSTDQEGGKLSLKQKIKAKLGNSSTTTNTTDSQDQDGAKPSLKEKIKAKLNKN